MHEFAHHHLHRLHIFVRTCIGAYCLQRAGDLCSHRFKNSEWFSGYESGSPANAGNLENSSHQRILEKMMWWGNF